MTDDVVEDHGNGTIVTFYSYKGGVGRSMALANIGCLMALEEKKVLLIDWDLEAPGLEKYFQSTDRARVGLGIRERRGIVDLLEGLASGSPGRWRDCVTNVEFLGVGIDIITAGRRDKTYRKRVQSIDWGMLYEEHDFGAYMEQFREEIAQTYDYILIDSRTGVTDIGDVCTVLLPDVIVTPFVSNEQNIEGTIQTIERARKSRSRLPVDRSRLLVLPLPSRDEGNTEYALASEWRARYATVFRKLLEEWLPREVKAEEYFDRIYIPYVPIWSFGERLSVIESRRELSDPNSLGRALLNVCRLLVNELDWYAFSDDRNLTQVTAARTELREAEERYAADTAKLSKRASSASRRGFIVAGASLVVGVGAGAWALRKTSNAPTVAFSISVRRSFGSGVTAAAIGSLGTRNVADVTIVGIGTADGAVTFRDTVNDRFIQASYGHNDIVEAIAFSPDRRGAATGARDGSVTLWNPADVLVTSDADQSWDRDKGQPEAYDLTTLKTGVSALAYSADGTGLFAGTVSGTLLRLGPYQEEILFMIEDSGSRITSLTVSPDGSLVASGSENTQISLRSATFGELRSILEMHSGPVTCLVFTPDGTILASASLDGTIVLTKIETGVQDVILAPDGKGITKIAFSFDGSRLVAGAGDGTVWVIDVIDKTVLATLPTSSTNVVSAVVAVSFARDGRSISLLTADGVFVSADLVALAV